jgi:MFS family permease
VSPLPPISGPSQSVCAWRVTPAMSTSLLIDRLSNRRNARPPRPGLSTRAGRRGAAYGTYFSLSFGVGALAGSAGGIVADRSGPAAVFGFLGLVAVVNTLGGLAVRVLLDRRSESTGRASAA